MKQLSMIETMKQKLKQWKFKIKMFIPRMRAKYKLYQKNRKILKELRSPFAQPDKQVLWENFIRSRKAESTINLPKNKKSTGLDTPTDITIARIVRKIITDLDVLKPIVGIQPMSGPVGLVFAMQYSEAPKSVSDMRGSEGMRLQLEIVKAAVEAGTRKLNATWTLEAAQDVRVLHGIDIEDEIISIMAQEILLEIVAANIANVAVVGSVDSITNCKAKAATSISTQIRIAASSIAANTRRAAGNFAIVDYSVFAMLSTDTSFVQTPYDKNSPLPMVGILNGSIKVYASYLMPSNVNCIVGYKGGNGETDCGVIYCPYVIATAGQVTMDPRTFCPSISFYTRHGIFCNDGALSQAKHYYKSLFFSLELEASPSDELPKPDKKPRVTKKRNGRRSKKESGSKNSTAC